MILIAIVALVLGVRTGGVLGGLAKLLALIGFVLSLVDGALRVAHRREQRSLREDVARIALVLSIVTWFVAHALPHGPQWIMNGSYTLRLDCSRGSDPDGSSIVLIDIVGSEGQVTGRAHLGYIRMPPPSGGVPAQDPLAPQGFTPFGDTSLPFESDTWNVSGSQEGNDLTLEVGAPVGWWTFKGTMASDGSFSGTATYWTGRWAAKASTMSGHATPLPGWIYWFD